ncbi:MAG TPA: hypothetical protein VNH83_28335 [Bryobacteraceae bacterium]|nr:hypothetical protein [Bryobacteraceae bacterium]
MPREERVRICPPHEDRPTIDSPYMDLSEAQELVALGLRTWKWENRWLSGEVKDTPIRGASCGMSGVSRGYQPMMKTVERTVGVSLVRDGGGRNKDRSFRTKVITRKVREPELDEHGKGKLERSPSTLERFAFDHDLSDALEQAQRKVVREVTTA